MTTVLRRLLGSALALAAPALVLITYFAVRADLPEPLPVHWGLHGEVNNTASIGGFFTTTIVIVAVLALAALAAIYLAHTPVAGRMLAAMLVFGAWIAAGTWAATVAMSAGAARAQDVSMPWYAIAPVVVVPILLGIGAWVVLPGQWQNSSVPAATPSDLVFAPGEVVVWIDHAHATWARWTAVVAALVAVAMWWVAPPVVIPVGVVAVALAMTSELAVRIDIRGVHTLWGPFGWPRPRIPLDVITSVRTEHINPMRWGGWGYRVSPRGVAAVIRSGPGLVVSRSGRPDYAVTIPHAAEGADVLNALLARERTARRAEEMRRIDAEAGPAVGHGGDVVADLKANRPRWPKS